MAGMNWPFMWAPSLRLTWPSALTAAAVTLSSELK